MPVQTFLFEYHCPSCSHSDKRDMQFDPLHEELDTTAYCHQCSRVNLGTKRLDVTRLTLVSYSAVEYPEDPHHETSDKEEDAEDPNDKEEDAEDPADVQFSRPLSIFDGGPIAVDTEGVAWPQTLGDAWWTSGDTVVHDPAPHDECFRAAKRARRLPDAEDPSDMDWEEDYVDDVDSTADTAASDSRPVLREGTTIRSESVWYEMGWYTQLFGEVEHYPGHHVYVRDFQIGVLVPRAKQIASVMFD